MLIVSYLAYSLAQSWPMALVAMVAYWLGITRFFRMLLSAFAAIVAGMMWDKVGPQYVFLGFVAIDLFVRLPLLVGMPETLRSRIALEVVL